MERISVSRLDLSELSNSYYPTSDSESVSIEGDDEVGSSSEQEKILTEILDPKNLDKDLNPYELKENIEKYTLRLENVIFWLNENDVDVYLNITLREFLAFELDEWVIVQIPEEVVDLFQEKITELKSIVNSKISAEAYLDELALLKKTAESKGRDITDRVVSLTVHNALKKTANSLITRKFLENQNVDRSAVMKISSEALENIVKILTRYRNTHNSQIKNEVKKLTPLLNNFDADFYNFLVNQGADENSKKINKNLVEIRNIVQGIYKSEGLLSPRITPRKGNTESPRFLSPRISSPRVEPNLKALTWF